MSKRNHPLFMTRGVPGTHDINLINKTFANLKKKKDLKQLQFQSLIRQLTIG